MTRNWVHAGGEHQLPFMAAAVRALRDAPPPCPRCKAELRAYFHLIGRSRSTGSIWVWCGACHTHVVLPRVTPVRVFVDPFATLSREAFVALETSEEERFLDRLESMWVEGSLRS